MIEYVMFFVGLAYFGFRWFTYLKEKEENKLNDRIELVARRVYDGRKSKKR